MGQYALTFWLPTLVRNAGISEPLQIGLLSSLPYLCAIVAMILAGRSGDRRRERRWHLAIPMLVGAAALLLATQFGHYVALSVAFLCLAAAGILSASSLFWMLPTNLLGGMSAAAGIAAVNCFANLAGFFSPYLIGGISSFTGSPAWGMYLITLVLLAGSLLVFRIPAAQVNR
ncbi:Inner membrane transport protein RhmT [Serratia rubidaea]|nr:Inner membrane transport protein RhmT [Serratia rubidaea]